MSWHFAWRQSKLIRADTWIALAIPLSSAFILGEAYLRTDLNDAEAPSSCSYSPSQRLIQRSHVRELEDKGIVVIQNALTPGQLLGARRDIRTYNNSADGFGNHGNEEDVRQDRVAWIKNPKKSTISSYSSSEHQEKEPVSCPDEAKLPVGIDLSHCISLLRGITHRLEEYSYVGSHSHIIPQKCQLAVYRGDGSSGYKRHLDRCNNTIYELGLLEWLRLSDYRSRAITAILYLNDEKRTLRDGGTLRCWVRNKENADEDSQSPTFGEPIDIRPTGGNLVIFDSDRVEHMVLPSSRDRYALTLWVSGTQPCKVH